jgi:hypothetical protein
MNEISGYVFLPLREGDIALYRGSGSGLPPILLVAAVETSPGCVEGLEHEYAFKSELEADWAARPIALTHYNDRMISISHPLHHSTPPRRTSTSTKGLGRVNQI